VKTPREFNDAFAQAHALMDEHQVPVVLEFILERVTNISMGTEIDNINEFEEILCLDPSLSLRTSTDMDITDAVCGVVWRYDDERSASNGPERLRSLFCILR
jgi:hypothetical protein